MVIRTHGSERTARSSGDLSLGGPLARAMLTGLGLVIGVLVVTGCSSEPLPLTDAQMETRAREDLRCPGDITRADFGNQRVGFRGCERAIQYELRSNRSRMEPFPRMFKYRDGIVPLSFLSPTTTPPKGAGNLDSEYTRRNNPELLRIAQYDLDCRNVVVAETSEGSATASGCGKGLTYNWVTDDPGEDRWIGIAD